MPARRVARREQVHGLALVGVRHDPSPYPRDHGHHVAAAVKVGLGDHLATVAEKVTGRVGDGVFLASVMRVKVGDNGGWHRYERYR